jgi:hypothetical protein
MPIFLLSSTENSLSLMSFRQLFFTSFRIFHLHLYAIRLDKYFTKLKFLSKVKHNKKIFVTLEAYDLMQLE